MVLDASAIIAAISREPDSSRFQETMRNGQPLAISTVTVLETKIVLHSRHGAEAVRAFDELLKDAGINVVPFDAEMSVAPFDAFQRFGKGQGSPAQLNIVDCVVYALAKLRDEALLFKGGVFEKTDIKPALA